MIGTFSLVRTEWPHRPWNSVRTELPFDSFWNESRPP